MILLYVTMAGRLIQRLLAFFFRLLPRALRRRISLLPYRPAEARARLALQAPQQQQLVELKKILQRNRGTEFGQTHAFDQLSDLASFTRRLPLRGYREFVPYLQRHHHGEANILVADPVLGFALSGGSRGQPRAIPVTAAGVELWHLAEQLLLQEAITHCPEVAQGCVLHLAPCYEEQTAPCGLPQLPTIHLMESLTAQRRGLPLAVPSPLFSIDDEDVRYYLILRLAAVQPVTILRAAAPGTLTILAEQLEKMSTRLIADLAQGTIEHGERLPQAAHAELSLSPAKDLARRLERHLRQHGRLLPQDLWPTLRLLVCATTGPAKTAAQRLADRYGNLPLLDPGHRTAEGIITWPWLDAQGGLLALAGQHLELLFEKDSAMTVCATELTVGQRVRPVLTGPNGLYRYVLDDVLQVIAQQDGPRLVLLGKASHRLALESGFLQEEDLREAVVAATRRSELSLSFFSGWLETPRSQDERLKASSPPASWLGRLWRRNPPPEAASVLPRPRLIIALEPLVPLNDGQARQVLAHLEQELDQVCEAYARLKNEARLGRSELLVLKPGFSARLRQQKLARGAGDGHTPFPVLRDDPWPLSDKEIEAHVVG